MKVYEVNYEEVTIVSKFVDTATVAELEDNQFLTEWDATANLEQHIEDLGNAFKHQSTKEEL